ncbi:MAG: type II toxin-antitoxin system HicA family toxin [Ferruginibacter sp.]|nr:type II toxin-antitoxin system HicA family toxin [Cytophagales bacterium]
MKASVLIRVLEQAGWQQIRQQGIHCILSHPTQGNLISVPDLGEQALQPAIVNDIAREAGLKGRVYKIQMSPGRLLMVLKDLLGLTR